MRKNIKAFYELYSDHWPACLTDQLVLSEHSPEHPIYHPELLLIAHIDIVIGRALLRPEKELHFAAMLHDITKSGFCPALWSDKRGKMVTIDAGSYWQNVMHPLQAEDFMQLPEVADWLTHHNVDIEFTKKLVGGHMQMKLYMAGEEGQIGGMGETKRRAFLDMFNLTEWEQMVYFSSYCDNMLANEFNNSK